MKTFSFRQAGTFTKEFEIDASNEDEARDKFYKMSTIEREDFLVFDDFDVDFLDVEEI